MWDTARRDQFRESVLRRLYPHAVHDHNSNSSSDSDDQHQHDEHAAEIGEYFDVAPEIPEDAQTEDGDNLNNKSPTNNTSQYLTRAHRKKIRRKKLREAVSHRRKVIGPLLQDGNLKEPIDPRPSSPVNCLIEAPKVNDSGIFEVINGGISDPTGQKDFDSSKSHGKVKCRRLAKKSNQDESKQQSGHGKAFVVETCKAGLVVKHI